MLKENFHYEGQLQVQWATAKCNNFCYKEGNSADRFEYHDFFLVII